MKPLVIFIIVGSMAFVLADVSHLLNNGFSDEHSHSVHSDHHQHSYDQQLVTSLPKGYSYSLPPPPQKPTYLPPFNSPGSQYLPPTLPSTSIAYLPPIEKPRTKYLPTPVVPKQADLIPVQPEKSYLPPNSKSKINYVPATLPPPPPPPAHFAKHYKPSAGPAPSTPKTKYLPPFTSIKEFLTPASKYLPPKHSAFLPTPLIPTTDVSSEVKSSLSSSKYLPPVSPTPSNTGFLPTAKPEEKYLPPTTKYQHPKQSSFLPIFPEVNYSLPSSKYLPPLSPSPPRTKYLPPTQIEEKYLPPTTKYLPPKQPSFLPTPLPSSSPSDAYLLHDSPRETYLSHDSPRETHLPPTTPKENALPEIQNVPSAFKYLPPNQPAVLPTPADLPKTETTYLPPPSIPSQTKLKFLPTIHHEQEYFVPIEPKLEYLPPVPIIQDETQYLPSMQNIFKPIFKIPIPSYAAPLDASQIFIPFNAANEQPLETKYLPPIVSSSASAVEGYQFNH